MPNVLKVFLENGQTKSFKYDNKTTVKVRTAMITDHSDGLVQERCNSSALAVELHLSCTNLLI